MQVKVEKIEEHSIVKYIFPVLILLATALVLFYYLNACFSAFTWGKFFLWDYGVYTNTIWNCGHGHPFKYLIDQSYLQTHLSFTLFLLGPLYWICDHPFLLSFVQWVLLVGGAIILWRTAICSGIRSDLSAALAFFYVVNPFTQKLILSEFHGVSLFLLLIPWLYSCLSQSRKTAWIPMVLLLGVREEVGVIIVPIILYFAIKNRWRLGWILAIVALGYGVIALKWLFPFFSGMAYQSKRGQLINPHILKEMVSTLNVVLERVKPLLWYVVAICPFIRKKGWVPLVIFPLVSVIATAISWKPAIYHQESHYPANHVFLFTMALLESIDVSIQRCGKKSYNKIFYAIFLIGLTLVWHRAEGYLFLGRFDNRIYQSHHLRGLAALKAAQLLPKEGLLLCDSSLVSYCANRSDVTIWENYKDGKTLPDLVFGRYKYVKGHLKEYESMIRSGDFGVYYFDKDYFILKRGHSLNRNEETFKEYFSPKS